MKTIEKDILTVEEGIICSQVNCMGVMGSGLAKSIRDKWPKVYVEYKEYCDKFENKKYQLLGNILMVEVADNLFVANLFGQYDYGLDGRKTEYCAVNNALQELHAFISLNLHWKNTPVYIPYRMSSDRAGGDFNIILDIVEQYFPDETICKLL